MLKISFLFKFVLFDFVDTYVAKRGYFFVKRCLDTFFLNIIVVYL